MDDSGIVELYLNRDEAAIARTSEKYGQRLRSFSLGIVQDLQTAEECENDTYVEAWSSIPPHAPRDYFYAFLARITRHLSLNRCRERSRLKRSALVSELSAELEQCIPGGEDLDRRVDDRALAEAINGFLGALGEEKRNLFLRRYWYEDYESISEYALKAMGWAVSQGLVTGTSSTTLTPDGSAIRAQVATIFQRFMENVAK